MKWKIVDKSYIQDLQDEIYCRWQNEKKLKAEVKKWKDKYDDLNAYCTYELTQRDEFIEKLKWEYLEMKVNLELELEKKNK